MGLGAVRLGAVRFGGLAGPGFKTWYLEGELGLGKEWCFKWLLKKVFIYLIIPEPGEPRET